LNISLPVYIPFISSSCLIVLAWNSRTMLNKNGESGHHYLFSDFRENGFSFSPLSMMLAIAFSHIYIKILRYIPSTPSYLRAFIMNWCWILSKAFSAYIDMINSFLVLLLLICYITGAHFCILNHPVSLGWSQIGHDEWSFKYVVRFSSPLCYWVFLYECSLRRLAYSPHFWMCPCSDLQRV
jgi:hypothetical protein